MTGFGVARRLRLGWDGMSASTPPQSGRLVAVGVFEGAPQAQRAAQALAACGTDEDQIGLVDPGDLGGQGAGAANGATDLDGWLTDKGVPEGETRFYAQEVRSGRALLVVDATQDYDAVRDLILQHGGYDVQSRGAELARAEGAGVPGGTGARPVDVTGRWEDVASRYEMLWQQHYGTSDAEWEDMQPIYRYAWDVANRPDLRGRSWSEAEPQVRQEWEASQASTDWDGVSGPIRDVWEDVAAEAATFAEGGLDRNIPPTR